MKTEKRIFITQGFTLIELLVVVLIIGILAAVALPQYQKAVEKSRLTEALQIVANLQKSIDVWILANEKPSATIQFLGENPDADLDLDFPSLDCESLGGGWCNSNNFTYDAYCWDTGCEIDAERRKNGSGESDMEYMIQLFRDENGTWSKECTPESNYPYSTSICSFLETHGWVNTSN